MTSALSAQKIGRRTMETIREIMSAKGVTSAELARRLGTSDAYVAKLMRGQNMTIETVVKVCRALNLTASLHIECAPRPLAEPIHDGPEHEDHRRMRLGDLPPGPVSPPRCWHCGRKWHPHPSGFCEGAKACRGCSEDYA